MSDSLPRVLPVVRLYRANLFFQSVVTRTFLRGNRLTRLDRAMLGQWPSEYRDGPEPTDRRVYLLRRCKRQTIEDFDVLPLCIDETFRAVSTL
jgi:hypothetical protein